MSRFFKNFSVFSAIPFLFILIGAVVLFYFKGPFRFVQADLFDSFQNGQNADFLLSGIDFNETGGPLLFNHPAGIASDGTRLFLADRNNNRVLIWNELPQSGDEEPDLVLGQNNFNTNDSGEGLDELNWPTAVAVAGEHLIVADGYNHRLLIWNKIPGKNGQAADFSITEGVRWPWGLWSDGTRLAVANTGAGNVLIWNVFPQNSDHEPDVVLRFPEFGTPRSISSDGTHFVVSDHNAKVNPGREPGGRGGTFFWNHFPTSNDDRFDFFMASPVQLDGFQDPQGVVLWGPTFTKSGQFLALGHTNLYVWNRFPEDAKDRPDLVLGAFGGDGRNLASGSRDATSSQSKNPAIVRGTIFKPWLYPAHWSSLKNPSAHQPLGPPQPFVKTESGAGQTSIDSPPFTGSPLFDAGDSSSMVVVGDRLFISLNNGNRVLVYENLPKTASDLPNFALGSPDLWTNTLDTHFILTNPVPVTNGKQFFVSSDFDRKLYGWNRLPERTGQAPDFVIDLLDAPWDSSLFGNQLILAGKQAIMIWDALPTSKTDPIRMLRQSVGGVRFQEIRGVELDEHYFYVADRDANRVYVWDELPEQDMPPLFSLSVELPGRISSDGKHLVVVSGGPGGRVLIYPIAALEPKSQPFFVNPETAPMNLPEAALISHGKLFVADTVYSRVLIWDEIEDAISGQKPDTILGAEDLYELEPSTAQDELFWPGALSYDGEFLWVGEFKFSSRLMRFGGM